MCGIVGAVLARPGDLDFTPVVDSLSHRGPDGRGEYRRDNVWLGHRRLAIIDTTTGASQPMVHSTLGALTYNGEIYDHVRHREALEAAGHVFRTRSDTEVLLAGLVQSGPAFLEDLHGMYALAHLSADGRTLLLARDHVGMKPLYYWSGAAGVAFASEVRTLALLVRQLGGQVRCDGSALTDLLAWGSVSEPRTILAEVRAFPPAHYAIIDTRDPARLRFGTIATRGSASQHDSLRDVMHRAVERHLVSDRPIVLFLSGGVDSTVLSAEIAAASTQRAQSIHVALATPGTTDEPDVAARTAQRAGFLHHVVQATEWQSTLENVLGHYDQPSIDGLNTFIVAQAARDHGFRVAMSGVGADEVFGGYQNLRWSGAATAVLRRAPLVSTLAEHATMDLAHPRLRRLGVLAEGARTREPVQRSWRRLMARDEVAALLPGLPMDRPHDEGADPLALERATYLRDVLLRDTDVLGMANSVEIRAPFLDPDVIELAATIGTQRLLSTLHRPKWPLRQAYADRVHPSVLRRQKTGFSLDVAGWLLGRARPMLDDALAALSRRKVVNEPRLRAVARQALAVLPSRHPSAWGMLFAFVQLEEQLRRWGEP